MRNIIFVEKVIKEYSEIAFYYNLGAHIFKHL